MITSAEGLSAVRLGKPVGAALRAGHPWVWRAALARDPRPDGLPDGALVVVLGRDGARLGWGFWDRDSPVAVRLLSSRPPPARATAALIRATVLERLRRALARRLAALDVATTNAFRWVHGEADGLPGIHVDLYAGHASARADGRGARAFYAPLADWLRAAAGPIALQGLRWRERGRRGPAPDAPALVEVLEHGLRFGVDLAHGQKGGLFLDQRDNRVRVAALARGRRVLNLFGYTGGFSVHAAAAGAARVDTVDLAAPAIAAARENFRRNQLDPGAHGFFARDAFEFLAEAAGRGERWDIVVCDPPSFAPSKKALPAARRAYRRLFAQAAALVAPGGLFCPASCSSHVDRALFLQLVTQAAGDAGRRFELVELRGAGADHPVSPRFPEGDYLKFALGRLAG